MTKPFEKSPALLLKMGGISPIFILGDICIADYVGGEKHLAMVSANVMLGKTEKTATTKELK